MMMSDLPASAIPPRRLVEVRCRDCGRLLCRADADRGRIEIVCPDRRCKRYQTVILPKSD